MEKNKTYDFSKETSLIAYLDLSNMFGWQDTLKWRFSIYHVIEQLFKITALKEIRIYYGLNHRDFKKSANFHKALRSKGAIVINKPVKWVKKKITRKLFVKSGTLELFDGKAHSKLDELIEYLQGQRVVIEEAKCNFDVEIALDMLDVVNKISGILLFSGDSDFKEPLDRLKLKGKNIYVFGVRGQVAKELWKVLTKFVDFGQWYQGSKMRKSRSFERDRVS